jgi:hypothetical protein
MDLLRVSLRHTDSTVLRLRVAYDDGRRLKFFSICIEQNRHTRTCRAPCQRLRIYYCTSNDLYA